MGGEFNETMIQYIRFPSGNFRNTINMQENTSLLEFAEQDNSN
jgi:hypothetical protein